MEWDARLAGILVRSKVTLYLRGALVAPREGDLQGWNGSPSLQRCCLIPNYFGLCCIIFQFSWGNNKMCTMCSNGEWKVQHTSVITGVHGAWTAHSNLHRWTRWTTRRRHRGHPWGLQLLCSLCALISHVMQIVFASFLHCLSLYAVLQSTDAVGWVTRRVSGLHVLPQQLPRVYFWGLA